MEEGQLARPMEEIAARIASLKTEAIQLRNAGDKRGALAKVKEMRALQAEVDAAKAALSLPLAEQDIAAEAQEEDDAAAKNSVDRVLMGTPGL